MSETSRLASKFDPHFNEPRFRLFETSRLVSAIVWDVFYMTVSANQFRHIGGGVTLTNNGISLLPTFSLEKPTVIFDLSVGSSCLL